MSSKTMWAVAAVLALAALAGVGYLAARKISGAPERGSKPWPGVDEKQIVAVLDGMLTGPHSDILSVPPDDGRILRLLAETAGAENVVEIGTSNGYATLWLCLALRTTGGKITTFEIDPERIALARENFEQAGVDEFVTIFEGDAHENVTKLTEPIDIIFIDADKGGYLDYLNKLLPLVRPGGLVVAHDAIDSAERMQEYLDAVTTNTALETVVLKGGGPGISVTLKKQKGQ